MNYFSVPTQKMPRLLTTSASAVRRLRNKAVLMDIDVEGEEIRETQIASLVDMPKKWHIPPAFSVEFIAYVIDRERRINFFFNQPLLGFCLIFVLVYFSL